MFKGTLVRRAHWHRLGLRIQPDLVMREPSGVHRSLEERKLSQPISIPVQLHGKGRSHRTIRWVARRGPRQQTDSRHDSKVILVYNPSGGDYELVHEVYEPSPFCIVMGGKIQNCHVEACEILLFLSMIFILASSFINV